MKKYELALVVSAKVEDEVRVATLGGQITGVDDQGKKQLAYEIQKMNEGFYYFIQFDAETTMPGELEQRLRIMDNVLRYLVVKAEED